MAIPSGFSFAVEKDVLHGFEDVSLITYSPFINLSSGPLGAHLGASWMSFIGSLFSYFPNPFVCGSMNLCFGRHPECNTGQSPDAPLDTPESQCKSRVRVAHTTLHTSAPVHRTCG